MFCVQCGGHITDGEHFCSNCGAELQVPGAVARQASPAGAGASRGSSRPAKNTSKPQDPYKDQIQALRLQIRQLKLDLKQVNNTMNKTRSHYNQSAAFLPWKVREGSKWFEDFRLMGKQPQKEQLQNEIASLQQQLLGLEQSQLNWKSQQGRG
jgi:predicted amidophosphoribosyltransferase